MSDEPGSGQSQAMARAGAAQTVAAIPPPAVGATLDPEGRRLLWRCRRGMKELDVILDRFARAELPEASAEQRRTFARLLELPDPLLADYLLGYAIPPESELVELLGRIAATRIAVQRSPFQPSAAPHVAAPAAQPELVRAHPADAP
ncbi:MAG: Tetratricopeptide repeat family protein [Gammaproteobacteria bacterium]|nr:Tetratricopeptide repeat family protein [Gammaproteobacteria bacterium]